MTDKPKLVKRAVSKRAPTSARSTSPAAPKEVLVYLIGEIIQKIDDLADAIDRDNFDVRVAFAEMIVEHVEPDSEFVLARLMELPTYGEAE